VIALAWIALICAAVPALLYLWNSFLFREPPHLTTLQPGDDASPSPPGFAGGEGWGEGRELHDPGRLTPSPAAKRRDIARPSPAKPGER
jgi:hypothetical protein